MNKASHDYCTLQVEKASGIASIIFFHKKPPQQCDLCDQPIAGMDFFADCRIHPNPLWTYAYQLCISKLQLTFDWNTAHLYQRDTDQPQRWRLSAGLPPDV